LKPISTNTNVNTTSDTTTESNKDKEVGNRYKQNNNQSTSTSTNTSTEPESQKMKTEEDKSLLFTEISFDKSFNLLNLYIIEGRADTIGIQYLDLKFIDYITTSMNPLDEIYANDKFNPAESFILINKKYQNEDDK